MFRDARHPVALFFLFFFRTMAIATYLLCGFFSNSCERAVTVKPVTILIVSLGPQDVFSVCILELRWCAPRLIDNRSTDGARSGFAFHGFLDSQGKHGKATMSPHRSDGGRCRTFLAACLWVLDSGIKWTTMEPGNRAYTWRIVSC